LTERTNFIEISNLIERGKKEAGNRKKEGGGREEERRVAK